VSELRVAVVGAGTAGCATALFLARAGHAVELFEQAAEPGPVGAGILLQPTGVSVLERLGVHEEVLDNGAPVRRLRCRTASGRTLLDLSYDVLGPGVHGVGLHRGTLFEALFRPLAEAGVEVRTGRRIGGPAEVLDAGFDLVVAADGARSALRAADGRVRAYPWGALWFIGERRDLAPDMLDQVVDGTRFLAGVLPTGRHDASVFFSVPAARPFEPVEGGLDAWRADLERRHPAAAAVAAQVADVAQLQTARYLDVVMRDLHRGPLVFVGDAGHAMSPQLGQGANLALRDAAALADCLAGTRDVPAALARFSARRRAQVRFYGFASRSMTPFFQSARDRLAVPRDLLLGPASRLPWVGRQMVRVMSGLYMTR
jgi:2-polyprenyl-6-methoxyphenol hydroxylase-like FAD-dependent oxidoreductase